MKKAILRRAIALLTAFAIVSLSIAMPAVVFADELEMLPAPTNLVLNRGHIEDLAFGGPMGLSWDEVDGSATFTVFAFRNLDEDSPNEAYASVEGIDTLYLNVNIAFDADLSNGPFWLRVQAVADDGGYSALSVPIGPFWNTLHSDELSYDPEASYNMFFNSGAPIIIIDTRRPAEREEQGNVVGDVHVPWPNAVAVEEGVTHASFQEGILAAWQNFIDNELTDEHREHLNPYLAYRDIGIFVY